MGEKQRIVGCLLVTVVVVLLATCFLVSNRDWSDAILFALLAGIAVLVPFVTVIFVRSERSALILSPLFVSIGALISCVGNPKAISLFPQIAGIVILSTSPFWLIGTLLAGKLLVKAGKTKPANQGMHPIEYKG